MANIHAVPRSQASSRGTTGIGLGAARIVAEHEGSGVIVGNRADKVEAARKELVALAGEDKVAAYSANWRVLGC